MTDLEYFRFYLGDEESPTAEAAEFTPTITPSDILSYLRSYLGDE